MTFNDVNMLSSDTKDKSFDNLNDMQKKAVLSTEGPLLVLAGAGSGKTTVLVNRIAHIIRQGYARPWEILAITFTNKAAGELKERLCEMLGEDANDIWASTFHASCVRILRRNAELLGYSSNFTIYDTDDSKRVIKDCLNRLGLSDKILSPKAILNAISRAKDILQTPAEYLKENYNDLYKRSIGNVYEQYQKALKTADAMDFDDIIVNTVTLLRDYADVREYYQHKFKYVLVDEYQDTNHAQYLLTSLLAGGYNNICVVGDDDQSIYRFRGATIDNILNFEEHYRSAKVIRLEQNYRSTQTILDAANNVISKNINRKGKSLWTKNTVGEKINYHLCDTAPDEGRFIAEQILSGIDKGDEFKDFAVLYRMNSQSNLIEQSLVRMGIPYRVIGGHKFYERKEIKDAIAYLSVVANTSDAVRLQRIINEPKRGIGAQTLALAAEISAGLGISLFEVIKSSEQFPKLSRAARKLTEFAKLIEYFVDCGETMDLYDLFIEIMNKSGYIESLDLDKETAEDRKQNLNELANNLKTFSEENPQLTLNDFLQEVSLMTDIDNYNASANAVVLMTVHAAKGLEFPTVFLAGMEETVFPSAMSSMAGTEEIEEERRLAYVAITRAKKQLYITRAKTRIIFGSTKFNPESRFVNEIPDELLTKTGFGESPFTNPFFPGKEKEHQAYASNQSFSDFVASSNKTSKVQFASGDSINHSVFGQGVVLSAKPMGNDTMLEVAFTNAGTKKIMANYSKIEKI